MRLTPGELFALADVRAEEDEAEWFRVAWLASQIGPRVWASKGATPYELLGWERPATVGALRKQPLEQIYAFWNALTDKTQRGH